MNSQALGKRRRECDEVSAGLVLARSMGQAVYLFVGGQEICIRIFEHATPGRVKVAIKAPPEVQVLREELLYRQASA
jgi:sRNA-binding carbon storage regulator CsrA